MRSRLDHLVATLRARPRLVVLGLLATVFVVATWAAAFGLGQKNPQAVAATPTFTYRTSWTMLELFQHIQGGEVAAITGVDGSIPVPEISPVPTLALGATPAVNARGVPATASPVLVARTKSGQTILIDLSVTIPEAVAAIRSIGYDSLITKEALAVAEPGPASAGSNGLSPSGLLAQLIPLGLLLFLVYFLMGASRRSSINPVQRGASNFQTVMPSDPQAVSTTSAADVHFADVAGCEEAKLELREAVDFLKHPERFARLGAKSPRGIMLYGPPGTGKTMLAKAVAVEAGVPFIAASASSFVEMYVGTGAKRVRDLFDQAKKHGRCVIFVDEFDAIGKKRGGLNSHEEREQTLNELLVQMDGFSTSTNIIVIGATNRLDVLDEAVLRPGRFTRKVQVPLPDVDGRRAILAVHARNKPFEKEVSLDDVAEETFQFSGADLADLLNEAAILASRRGADRIGPDDVHAGFLKVALGTSRHRSMNDRERAIIAYHEVGHAIAGKVHHAGARIKEISLFQHGEALGVTVSTPDDNSLPSEDQLRAQLIALMGGRVAEELVFHEVTGGASNDFEKATAIATSMVMIWGMGRDPLDESPGASGRGRLSVFVSKDAERLPTEIREAQSRAIRAILDAAYATARATLITEMDRLRAISNYLYEHERMSGRSFEALWDGQLESPGPETDVRPASSKPRAWHEIGRELGRVASAPARAAVSAPGQLVRQSRAPVTRLRRRRPRFDLRRRLGLLLGLDETASE